MAQRTGCERFNSLKKVTYRLGERPGRFSPSPQTPITHPIPCGRPLSLPRPLALACSALLTDYPSSGQGFQLLHPFPILAFLHPFLFITQKIWGEFPHPGRLQCRDVVLYFLAGDLFGDVECA